MNGDRRLRLILDVTVAAGADPESVAERAFDLIGNDPDHLIDEILTVDNYEQLWLDQ